MPNKTLWVIWIGGPQHANVGGIAAGVAKQLGWLCFDPSASWSHDFGGPDAGWPGMVVVWRADYKGIYFDPDGKFWIGPIAVGRSDRLGEFVSRQTAMTLLLNDDAKPLDERVKDIVRHVEHFVGSGELARSR